jgi:hypothetical protein
MRLVVKDRVYRHYKGDRYIVLFTGEDSNNDRDREPTVIYMSLDDPHAGEIKVRRVSEFLSDVMVDGVIQPRFELIKKWES